MDKDVGVIEPVLPPTMESTPFKLVEEVKDLKELAAKLRNVNEFAVKSYYHSGYFDILMQSVRFKISNNFFIIVVKTVQKPLLI